MVHAGRTVINLGVVAETGKPFYGDLNIILRSNVLVQANSGGGKSWLLRRMIEQTFGRVPQIIIDPEGEFSTLRQKFDLVLVGKGGDTPADLRSAQLLAHRLLELGASAVIDLFEMSKAQRPVWVAAFVQALVDAPKKLWRDLLLYVLQLTSAGRDYPIDVELPPTDPEELLAYWKREIGTEKIGQLLEIIVQQGPITNEALMEASGMANSGTFSNYKGALVGRGLIEKRGNIYVATEPFTR